MKTIKLHSVLQSCFSFFATMCLLQSCNKDVDPVPNEPEEKIGLGLSYPDSIIETTYRVQGSTGPNLINWNNEKGTLSMSSPTNENIRFEEETGFILWTRHLPLGKFDLIITAKNSRDSVNTKIQLNNRYVQGFFNGNFIAGDPSEIPNSFPDPFYQFILNEDQTASLTKYSEPTFSVLGTWEGFEDGTIGIEYTYNEETTYAKGIIDTNGYFIGVYGNEKDASGVILNPKGKFIFYYN